MGIDMTNPYADAPCSGPNCTMPHAHSDVERPRRPSFTAAPPIVRDLAALRDQIAQRLWGRFVNFEDLDGEPARLSWQALADSTRSVFLRMASDAIELMHGNKA